MLKENQKEQPGDNSIIIPPVYIEDGVMLKNSVIGPNVSTTTPASTIGPAPKIISSNVGSSNVKIIPGENKIWI